MRKPLHALLATRWPTEPLAAVVEEMFVGLPVSRYQAKPGEPADEVPVLSVGDVSDGSVAPFAKIAGVRLRPGSIERFHVRPGDLVMTCRGTVLKAARVPESHRDVIPSSNLIVIRSGSRLLPALLLAMLRGAAWQEMLRARSRSSSGIIQLTLRDLEDLPIPLLPMSVQHELAALIEAEEKHYRLALQAATLRREITAELVSEVLLGAPSAEPTFRADDA